MTATVLVNRSEISELKYFGLHNEFSSAVGWNNMDFVEAPAGQRYTTSLQNDQNGHIWGASRVGASVRILGTQRELGSEMWDYVCDDFKKACKAVLGYRGHKDGTCMLNLYRSPRTDNFSIKVPARIDILDPSVEATELLARELLTNRSNSVERGTQESNITEGAWKMSMKRG
ncbi:hypothetical protein C8R44DRAFT_746944 [Mycena epipterygia]|nr:hypothetical protein C8R44DRAFT_746944 [Mycena epipterygia]